MMNTTTARLVLGSLAMLASVSAISCDRSSPPPPLVSDEVVAEHLYEGVIGVITGTPRADSPASEFRIRHVHIPEFKGRDNTVHTNRAGVPGMCAMDMAFPTPDTIDLAEFEVGDKVAFSFFVRWTESSQSYGITQIITIPDDTEISYDDVETRDPWPMP